MSETPEQETARLLKPYEQARNDAAHQCLAALLDGRHEEAAQLLQEYQVAVMAYEGAVQICQAFDQGTVTFEDNSVEIRLDGDIDS